MIDPLVPRGEEELFFDALDRDVERVGLPVAVLLTAPWHRRDAHELAKRYGTMVWAHDAARERLDFATQTGPLPAGIETFSPAATYEGDVAFYLRPPRALVVSEFFMGVDSALRVCPPPNLGDRETWERSLHRLLDWAIEHVLVSHGDPVIGDGAARIREALGV